MALASVFVGGVFLAGCGEPEERPHLRWKTGDTLPADFPTDIPVYPKATLDKAVTSQDRDAGAFVGWRTTDPIPEVRHFYTTKLDEQGWHVTAYPGLPAPWMGEGGVTVVGTKWGRTVSFAIGAQDEKTLISMAIPGNQ